MNLRQIGILFFILVSVLSALAETKDSISKIEIGNLSFENNELWISFELSAFREGTGTWGLSKIHRKYKLPVDVAKEYLAMIYKVGLLSVSSNSAMCIDCTPFSLRYVLNEDGEQHKITAYFGGMTEKEKGIIAEYKMQSAAIVNIRSREQKFQDDLPDGNYLAYGGMTIGKTYRKKNGQFTEVELPLYVLNGNVISVDDYEQLDFSGNRYELTECPENTARAIYGGAGRFGVVLIREISQL